MGTGDKIPRNALEEMLQQTNLATVLNARSASNVNNAAASHLVKSLQATNGVLPEHAWQAFPDAVVLHVPRVADANRQQQLPANLAETLKSTPARVHGLHIHGRQHWHPAGALLFAQSVTASACCNIIRHLTLEPPITTAAADIILQGLPNLTKAELTLYSDPDSAGQPSKWRPAAPPSSLTEVLGITTVPPPAVGQQQAADPEAGFAALVQHVLHQQAAAAASQPTVDLAGLSPATKLKSLHLSCSNIASSHSISSLQALQHLQVHPAARLQGIFPALQHLLQLQHLDLDGLTCQEQDWALLACLPKLKRLCLAALAISAAAPPAPSVASITTSWFLAVSAAEGEERGCLARLLPGLQHLDAGLIRSTDRLVVWLQGHSSLRQLRAEEEGVQREEGVGVVLAGLPELRDVCFREYSNARHGILSDLAACGKLTSLVYDAWVSDSNRASFEAAVAGLAVGPVSSSVQVVALSTVQGPGVAVDTVGGLVRGGMVALREVDVWLEVPDGVSTAQQLQQVLQERGAAAGVRCECGVEGQLPAQVWCKLRVPRVPSES